MPDTMTDKWVKQLALLAALLCAGLSLSHGVALATCGARFALVYCVTMLMGRLACQMWLWAASQTSFGASSAYRPVSHSAEDTTMLSSEPSSDEAMMGVRAPIGQGG